MNLAASLNPNQTTDTALSAYYAHPAVRGRIADFLGQKDGFGFSCCYMTGDNRETALRQPRPASHLWACLDQGMDISRSLWDSRSLIAHFDLEYVNFDHPAEAYEHPERTFSLQEPVRHALLDLLGQYGIQPLQVMSGRGYHVAWQIPQTSELLTYLAQIGRCPSSLLAFNQQPHPVAGKVIDPELAHAFSGLGLILEWVAHRIKETVFRTCPIPVEITAVEVGPLAQDREMISIDLSEFGDPLQARTLRVPFTVYHKPAQESWLIGSEVARSLPLMFFIPCEGLDTSTALEIRTDDTRASEWARQVSSRIPDQTAGTGDLITAYQNSRLAEFHRWFYSEEPHPPENWAGTYDTTPLDGLPACVRLALEHPNDILLHPSSIRLVTRFFLGCDWHPRHIAGLITSKFARDHGWGRQWNGNDPATRAEFYVRIFAGLFLAGPDDLVDFNCQSTREQHLCPVADCPFNLMGCQQSALERREHDQLAHRSIDGMFLSKKHS